MLLKKLKKVNKNKLLVLILLLTIIFGDSSGLIITGHYNYYLLAIFLVLLACFKFLKFDSKWFFTATLITLIFITVCILFQKNLLAEKLAVWTFYLMSLGVIVCIIELSSGGKLKSKKR